MKEVEVLSPGIYSSIQDMGRTGYRAFGIPVSGSMDQVSPALGNSILGNDINAPVLEMTLSGVKLLFSASASIAVCGADMSASINNQPIGVNKVESINPGDILAFGTARVGCRTYLCVKNGFNVKQQFGSSSTYHQAGLGFPLLKKGMKLYYDDTNSEQHTSLSRVKPPSFLYNTQSIEVMAGPEYHIMEKEILSDVFKIGADSNRMGYRLTGNKSHKHSESILTSTVMPGTVQLPPSGNPVILMRDCQTTGGYPRVLQVTEMGINVLAQKKPGDEITFEMI